MKIVAYGLPGAQGSKKFVGTTKSGKGIMVENSDKVKPWRTAVATAAEAELYRLGRPAPLDQPLRVTMVFTFLRPASVKRSKRSHPSVTPDLSKIVRSTEDALTQAGVWRDDCLVVQLLAAKYYPNEGPGALDRSGVLIFIEPVVPWIMSGGTPLLEIGTSHEGFI